MRALGRIWLQRWIPEAWRYRRYQNQWNLLARRLTGERCRIPRWNTEGRPPSRGENETRLEGQCCFVENRFQFQGELKLRIISDVHSFFSPLWRMPDTIVITRWIYWTMGVNGHLTGMSIEWFGWTAISLWIHSQQFKCTNRWKSYSKWWHRCYGRLSRPKCLAVSVKPRWDTLAFLRGGWLFFL
jgi:hypothetical protein